MTARRRRLRGAAASGALLLVLVPASQSWAEPTDEDVRAARDAVQDAAGRVAAIEVELAAHSAAADAAWTQVQSAAETYAAAEAQADDARADADEARRRSAAADAAREEARAELGVLAQRAYRSGGGMDQIAVLLSADGLEDVLRRSEALDRLGTRAERAVQRFTAADLAARTLAQRADDAAAAADDAAAQAQDALDAAEAAQAAAEEQVATAAAARESLVVELAALRGTAVAVERERQEALDRERREREEAAAAASRGVTRDGTPTAPGRGAAGGPSDGEPSAPPERPAQDERPGSTQPETDRSGSDRDESGRDEPDPSGSDGSGPDRAESPDPPSTSPSPTPTPTPTPPPDRYGLGTGSQRGSAAQGAAALEWARAQVGKDYVWGGTGPDGFDCSGLTSQAWRAAGVSITRTSRSQYVTVRKITYGEMRPGDLIFYGSNPADPQSITHVAMYAGGGQMVEAPRPGVPVRVTPVRWSGTMPYAGRP